MQHYQFKCKDPVIQFFETRSLSNPRSIRCLPNYEVWGIGEDKIRMKKKKTVTQRMEKMETSFEQQFPNTVTRLNITCPNG